MIREDGPGLANAGEGRNDVQPEGGPSNGPAWLRARGLSRHFGALRALDEVDLDIPQGAVTALVGDNGAGKSTLVKLLSGAYVPSSGRIEINSEPVLVDSPKKARALGIATIFQELALVDNLSVYENIFLGRELVRHRFGVPVLERRRMRARVGELIASLGAHLPSPDADIAELSGGQRQAVAIARALDLETKVVIMDEPTAALAVVESRKVLDLIGRLRQNGAGVLLVSHNLHDVFEVADRIVVLRRGRKVFDQDRRRTDPQEVVSRITGAAVAAGPTEERDPTLT